MRWTDFGRIQPVVTTGRSISIVFHDEIERILSTLQARSTLFVKAPPLAGLSTLLTQLEKIIRDRDSKTIFISVGNLQSATDFARTLATEMNIDFLHEDFDMASQLTGIFDQISVKLRQEQIYLFIDDVDRVKSFEPYLNLLIQNLGEAHIVATCATTPKIDPLLALDVAVHRFGGLSINEMKALIEASKVEIDSQHQDEIMYRIYERTKGNPFLVRLTIAPALLEQQVLSLKDVDYNFDRAREEYPRRVVESLEVDIQEIFRLASLVRFDSELIQDLLGRIPEDSLRVAEEVGLLKQLETERMGSDQTEHSIFLSRIPPKEILELRASLIKEICQDDRALSLNGSTELIWQKIALRDMNSALQEFEKLSKVLFEQGNLEIFLELSGSFGSNLSLDSFYRRILALHFTGQEARALREIESRLPQATTTLEKARLIYLKARLERNLDQTLQSATLIESILNSDDVPEFLRVELIFESVLRHIYSNLDRVRELIGDFGKIVQNPEAPPSLLAKYHLCFGLYYQELGNHLASMESFETCARFHRLAGDKLGELNALFNANTASYNAGNITSSLASIRTVRNEAKRLSITLVERLCNRFEELYFLSSGQIQKALNLYSQDSLYPKIATGIDLVEVFRLETCAWSFVHMGKIAEAEEIYAQLSENLSGLDRARLSKRIKATMNIIKAFRSTDIERIKNEVNGFTWSDLNSREIFFQLNLILELNHRFYFPLKLSEIIPLRSGIDESKADNDCSLFYKQLIAEHYVAEGKIRAAEIELAICLERSKLYTFSFWELRSLLSLSKIALMKGDLDLAKRYLDDADQCAAHVDPCIDLDLLTTLKAIWKARSGINQDPDKIVDDFGQQSPLHRLLTMSLGVPDSRNSINLSRVGETYYQRLAAELNPVTAAQVHILSHDAEFVVNELKLPELMRKKYDVILDERSYEARFGKIVVSMRSKDILCGLLKVLLTHSNRSFTKEELTHLVWRERYNPQVHDYRVYTTIRRIRSLLKTCQSKMKIEEQAGKYRLGAQPKFLLISKAPWHARMSERQLWILDTLDRLPEIDRSTLQDLLKISSTAAKIELKSLIDRGLIQTVGQGRATRYRRSQSVS